MANKNHRSIGIKEKMDGSVEIMHKDEYEDSDSDDDYSYDDYDIEDEDEEIKEEMTPPEVTSWLGEDGKTTVKGVVVIFKHDWSTLGKRKTPPSAFDADCLICKKPFTPAGSHRVCCLPCGHMYGMSCINDVLQLSQSSGRCLTCNTVCTLKDVRVLYPSRTNSTLHKASASTKHFPFTEEGLRDFKRYALKRRADALKLRSATLERKAVVVDSMLDAMNQRIDAEVRRRALKGSRTESGKKVLDCRLDTLQQCVIALEREVDAFGCRADALRRRADILKWRAKACKASVNFFEQRYNEHMGWVREITDNWLE